MAADPQDAPRHAGQVVRRVLLRRNIVIDAETAQLVAAAVQAALQAGAPSRPPRRGPRGPGGRSSGTAPRSASISGSGSAGRRMGPSSPSSWPAMRRSASAATN